MDWRRGSRKKIMALYLYILVSWYVETDTIGAIDCKFYRGHRNFPRNETGEISFLICRVRKEKKCWDLALSKSSNYDSVRKWEVKEIEDCSMPRRKIIFIFPNFYCRLPLLHPNPDRLINIGWLRIGPVLIYPSNGSAKRILAREGEEEEEERKKGNLDSKGDEGRIRKTDWTKEQSSPFLPAFSLLNDAFFDLTYRRNESNPSILDPSRTTPSIGCTRK